MPPWRETAYALFPELSAPIEKAENSYSLWFELRHAFERAYDAMPKSESLIRRIYQYADWCDNQARGETAEDDLLTAVAVCFYEHIPEHPAAWNDMPRWFSLKEFDNMRGLWEYSFKKEGYLQLRQEFARRRKMFQTGLRRFDPKLLEVKRAQA
jgi:hypothetical protein